MTMRIALWICGCLAFAALPVDGGDRLAMTVQPAQSFAPSFLRVRVRIEPSAGNRWLEVIADSDGFYRSSEIPLDGDRAPVTIYFEFPGVPEGEYDIIGIVKDAAGHERSSVRHQVRVLGFELSH
jgi:hypothetical protein